MNETNSAGFNESSSGTSGTTSTAGYSGSTRTYTYRTHPYGGATCEETAHSISLYRSPKPIPMEQSNMRSLYTVFIVHPQTDEIVFEATLIAKNTQSAERKAIQMAGDKIAGDIEDYDFVVDLRGTANCIRPRLSDS